MQFPIPKTLAAGLLAACMLGALPAHANLVNNGGFETGDFTGWNVTSIDAASDGVDLNFPQAGLYGAYFGNPLGVSTISQTLSTVAGATYTVSFWLMAEADPLGNYAPNSFAFDWDGATQTSLTDSPPFGYQQYSFALTASSASTVLSFSFFNGPAFWDFDSVAVDAAAVPEPDALLLFATASVLAGAVSYRRKSH